MLDLLTDFYPWVKSLHILSAIAWMAGIFYLPRLFVYHAENVEVSTETDVLFQTMERKLFQLIMTPAMIMTWLCGGLLVLTPGVIDWSLFWPWIKAGSVIAMTWFHVWLGQRRKIFVAGTNSFSGKTYRIMNEFPTIVLVLIIISVVVKPF